MTKRNLKLDILRGFFLLEMYIDHISKFVGNNAFYFLNGFGNLWVSSAEGFVFLSGYLVGFIYYPKIVKNEFKYVFYRLWKRAGLMYLLGVFLTVLFSIWGMRIGLFKVNIGESPYRDLWFVIKNAIRY